MLSAQGTCLTSPTGICRRTRRRTSSPTSRRSVDGDNYTGGNGLGGIGPRLRRRDLVLTFGSSRWSVSRGGLGRLRHESTEPHGLQAARHPTDAELEDMSRESRSTPFHRALYVFTLSSTLTSFPFLGTRRRRAGRAPCGRWSLLRPSRRWCFLGSFLFWPVPLRWLRASQAADVLAVIR